LLASNNPGYQEFIENLQNQPLAKSIELEKELEDALATNLKVLKKFGYDLELYIDYTTKQSGRQLICRGNGGRIDLLCHDKTLNRYIVIELKNVRAGQNTFGQISNYMGWVQDRIAKGVPVSGLVISRGYDTRFESALKITDRICQINVEDLGFSIAPSKNVQEFNVIKDTDISKAKDKSKLAARSAKSREAGAWLKKGDALFDNEKYDEAISCYEKAIEIDPMNKWGWINKGAALAELSKFEEAISCYDKVIEMYPRSAQAWIDKGFTLNETKKYDEAVLAFNTAIEIKPNSSDAWNGKGFALANAEKYDESIQCYEQAIKSNPKNSVAWNNKGFVLMDQGKYAEAIQSFEKLIKLEPKSASAWSNNGAALYGLHKYEEAMKAFSRAIEIDPEEPIYWYYKSKALKSLNRNGEADSAFAKAKDMGYVDQFWIS
jgi:tetratricopeptide (TPR) repeat protein